MNAILLTNGTGWQRGAAPRKACSPSMPPQPGAAQADEGAATQAMAKPRVPESSGGGYLKRAAAGARVEAALFVSVQALMIACVVLVAAQLFATA